MTLETRLIAIARAVGADIKTATLARGDLAALSTTAKASLVAAINELDAAVDSLATGAGAVIDDAAGAGNTAATWSADKLVAAIAAAKTEVRDELTGGASAALDTLAELAAALGNDPNFAATIATEIGHRVRYDAVQALTTSEQAQACANIGVGNPEHDYVADYVAAKA